LRRRLIQLPNEYSTADIYEHSGPGHSCAIVLLFVQSSV
jgi:hypothetical protein